MKHITLTNGTYFTVPASAKRYHQTHTMHAPVGSTLPAVVVRDMLIWLDSFDTVMAMCPFSEFQQETDSPPP